MSALELIGVTKRYQQDLVLDDVSFSVNPAETLVLFGPSGAGKTVLLRIIAGVVEADSGKVQMDDEDVTELEAENRGVGMAFQNFALFPHMNAFDNIASALTAGNNSPETIEKAVNSVASLLKIDHVLHHMPRELSNGQKQRTALARALAGAPPLLLLDDPLRNVDAKLRFEMRLELPVLLNQQGATVVYVTQDYKEAMALGDRIAVLEAGKIMQIGSPEDIYLRPNTIEISRLFGDPVINLIDVTTQRDNDQAFTEISGQRVPLDASLAGPADTKVVLGIRPESIGFVPEGTVGAIPVNVESETLFNEKLITTARTNEHHELLISRPSYTRGVSSGRAFISIDQQAILLFDHSSGKVLQADSDSSNDEVAA